MSILGRYEKLGERINPQQGIEQAIRVNTLKISDEKLLHRLEKKGVKFKKIPFAPGYWFEADFSLGATSEYLQGFYYLQEAASQLPPLVLDPQAGDVILDMAAAPGSKTSQIAQMMQDKGVIVALDGDAHRLASLRNNIERLGINCVLAYKKDARFVQDLGVTFDKILLDAPCSGNYCVEKDFFSTKTVQGFRQRAQLQKELLKGAYKILRPGGTIVYSTCSLEPEENELVMDWFIKKFTDMKLEPTGLQIGDPGLIDVFDEQLDQSLSLTRRLWPHKTGTQGFFIAKVKKDG